MMSLFNYLQYSVSGFQPSISLCLFLLVSLTGCQSLQQEFKPNIVYTPPATKISDLPSAFKSLSKEEKNQDWAKELRLGDAFANEWDLYRAITCYKSALILLPCEATDRRLQIEYDLILCYYLGHKYTEAINIFEAGEIAKATPKFPAFSNLMVLLYDCYLQTQQQEKADCLFENIEKVSPETAQDLALYTDFNAGDTAAVQADIQCHPKKECMQIDFDSYYQFAKSPQKARTLNALLPGLGYYYVGQKKAAMTSFFINALFTAAAYQFFHKGYIAAGAITASIEYGWYYGGINGAGIAANEFNQSLFEGVGKKILSDNCCFPVLMFETSF